MGKEPIYFYDCIVPDFLLSFPRVKKNDKLVWLQSLSKEERAKVYAFNEELEKNDEAKAQRINEITELFQITANGRDSIDRDQFEELMAKFDQSVIEKGIP